MSNYAGVSCLQRFYKAISQYCSSHYIIVLLNLAVRLSRKNSPCTIDMKTKSSVITYLVPEFQIQYISLSLSLSLSLCVCRFCLFRLTQRKRPQRGSWSSSTSRMETRPLLASLTSRTTWGSIFQISMTLQQINWFHLSRPISPEIWRWGRREEGERGLVSLNHKSWLNISCFRTCHGW